MSLKKKISIALITPFALVAIVIGTCYLTVDFNACGRTFDDVEDVPQHEYGLLLGTSPITPGGARNFYYDNRIKAAVELYKAGKVKKIIASGGDYSMDKYGHFKENGCNELRSMHDSLVKYGVPHNRIILDYDGTRTLNSIVKAKEVFKIDSCIIISQQYHNERAIKLGDHYGLKAVGYNATPSHIRRNRIKNQARELLARVKLYIDLWFGDKPKFNTFAVKFRDGMIEEWYDELDSIPGIPGAISHKSSADLSYGFWKCFSTKNGKPFYYNGRHGYYVTLPVGMGYNQHGESEMGAHFNEFYNNDTTLIVSAGAIFYDVLLIDYPNYADTMKVRERQYLTDLGSHKTRKITPDVWISEGRINHANPENPPADRFLRKWLLRKDIGDRECEMDLTIFFNDSLSYRLPEFERIISQFPNLPTSL